MRIPWGTYDWIASAFVETPFSAMGCVSFEERSTVLPAKLYELGPQRLSLLWIHDPEGGDPSRRQRAEDKMARNGRNLGKSGVSFRSGHLDLLATEDEMLGVLKDALSDHPNSFVLDITGMPKRVFCLFTKRLLLDESIRRLIVTYVEPGPQGHTTDHLAYDPLPCDQLPGFSGPLSDPDRPRILVVSVGFESLSIRSLLEELRDRERGTRFLLPFPNSRANLSRQWETIRSFCDNRSADLPSSTLRAVAPYDAEEVCSLLQRWWDEIGGLTLASYGPKPHSLGMALFATKFDCGMYYTQPQSYNPDYSAGSGNQWAYVVKWDGISCVD